jgi:signal transduction histidine kinase/ligand-binding sensor domain-containing protein
VPTEMRNMLVRMASAILSLAAFQAVALDPSRGIAQYGHTAWRVQDGILSGAATSITQTRDGYVWVGTHGGLYRLDGARFVEFTAPSGESLRSPRITALLPTADGSLWIGTGSDLERWDGDRLAHYPSAAGQVIGSVMDVMQARNGTIWISRTRAPDTEGAFCEVAAEKLLCHGKKDGLDMPFAVLALEDPEGRFMVASGNSLLQWSPGKDARTSGTSSAASLDGIQTMVFDRDGSLLVGTSQVSKGLGMFRLQNEKIVPYVLPNFDGRKIPVCSLFFDSHRSLWIGTQGQGLYRVTGERVERYRATDGLSGDTIYGMFEDHEGNVWVGTSQGLDRFRDVRVSTYSSREGLANDLVNGVVASHDGAIYVSNWHSLDVLKDGAVTSLDHDHGLPGDEVGSLYEDREGRLWVGVDDQITIYSKGKFKTVKQADGSGAGPITSMAEDAGGNMWVRSTAPASGRLLRIFNDQIQEQFTREQVPFARSIAMAADPETGIWLPLKNGDLGHWHDNRLDVVALNRAPNTGTITAIIAAPDGVVYSGSQFGLVGTKAEKSQTLTTDNGLPCAALFTMLADENGLWLYAQCGLLSISYAELARWWSDSHARLTVGQIGTLDGAQPAAAGWFPRASRSPDGRLWFANSNVLQMFDPAHVTTNTLIPPVHIEQVIADRRPYAATSVLRFPALTQDLEIDYTAPSFVIPEKVHFRYQLEGHDKEWIDAQTRRQAFYTDLSPGQYRFRVTASNNDGVSNEEGSAVTFQILPKFYQTVWFRVICAVIVLVAGWLLYLARVRQLAARVRIRIETRMKEREQIARDLHDTLLQGMQGLIYTFHAGTQRLQKSEPARSMMEAALVRADEMLTEGRERVMGLRRTGSVGPVGSLEDSLSAAVESLSQESGVAIHVTSRGEPRQLSANAFEELYKIGTEAVSNSFRHAGASRIDVDVEYGKNELTLRVRDDGRGFDVEAALARSSPGHFGLLGMRERARRVQADFDVTSQSPGGTQLECRIRAYMAYEAVTASAFARWFGGLMKMFRPIEHP